MRGSELFPRSYLLQYLGGCLSCSPESGWVGVVLQFQRCGKQTSVRKPAVMSLSSLWRIKGILHDCILASARLLIGDHRCSMMVDLKVASHRGHLGMHLFGVQIHVHQWVGRPSFMKCCKGGPWYILGKLGGEPKIRVV